MSLVVPCTGCPAKLAAPVSAVGRQIRCPKCGAVVDVPALVAAEEVRVVEARRAPVRPRPVVDEDAEGARPRKQKRDRAAEDEPPPRRRKPRKAAKRGSSGVVVLLAVVGPLLVCGVVTVAFARPEG